MKIYDSRLEKNYYIALNIIKNVIGVNVNINLHKNGKITMYKKGNTISILFAP